MVQEADEFEVLLHRVQALTATRRTAEALALVQEHGHLNADARWWWLLGTLQSQVEDLEGALEAAVQARSRWDDPAFVLLHGAVLGRLEGRLEESIEVLREGVAQAPDHLGLRAQLVVHLAHLPTTAAVRREVEEGVAEILERDPDSAEHHASCVRALEMVGRTGPAAEVLASGLALAPQDRQLLLLSGQIRRGRSVVPQQQTVLQEILAVDPLAEDVQVRFLREVYAPLPGLLRLLVWHLCASVLALAGAVAIVPALGGGLSGAVAGALLVLAPPVLLGLLAHRSFRTRTAELTPERRAMLRREHPWAVQGLWGLAAGAGLITLGTLAMVFGGTGQSPGVLYAGRLLMLGGILLGVACHVHLYRGLSRLLAEADGGPHLAWAALAEKEGTWVPTYLAMVFTAVAALVLSAGVGDFVGQAAAVVGTALLVVLGLRGWSWVFGMGWRPGVFGWLHLLVVRTVMPLMSVSAAVSIPM